MDDIAYIVIILSMLACVVVFALAIRMDCQRLKKMEEDANEFYRNLKNNGDNQ